MQQAISRGKVDVFVTIDSSAADVSVVKVNEPLARSYYEALLQLKETFGLSGEVTPVELSRCPDVLSVTKAEENLEMLRSLLKQSIILARRVEKKRKAWYKY